MRIGIISFDIKNNKDEILKTAQDDLQLIKAINSYKSKLTDQNIEIFHQEKNILITDDGYYCAVYEKDIKFLPIEE